MIIVRNSETPKIIRSHLIHEYGTPLLIIIEYSKQIRNVALFSESEHNMTYEL
jgi:hypothetical protein